MPFYEHSDQHPSTNNDSTDTIVEVGRLQPAGIQDGREVEAILPPE